MKIIAYIIYGVSQALYKLFGYNTPSRKAWLTRKDNEIQVALDRQHYIKDVVNARTNGNYTTKEALDIAEANEWF